jgi:lipocalin
VDEVDLPRYVGSWYEVARFPNTFQQKCTGDVTAAYALRSGGSITVVNRCREDDGKWKELEGVAKLNRGANSNAAVVSWSLTSRQNHHASGTFACTEASAASASGRAGEVVLLAATCGSWRPGNRMAMVVPRGDVCST